MTRILPLRSLLAALCFLVATATLAAATYYVDSVGGNDANAGTSSAAPWQTLAKVNSVAAFAPGDTILFKRGASWSGQLWPKGSGTSGAVITIDAYGSGALPLIQGGGATFSAVLLQNQEYWEIKNLEVTNYDATAGLRVGVYVVATDVGVIRHIHLIGLEVHDVNGTGSTNGGIYVNVTGTTTPTYYDGILIDGCYVHHCTQRGIVGPYSPWDDRTPTANTNWTPSLNVIIQNNVVTNSSHQGLVWRVSTKPVIRNNLFADNGQGGSGNAMFVFNTDGAVIQENEAYGQQFDTGDTDAAGFDIDYRTKNTILQYNYAHDNGQGGITVTAGDVAFNVSPIVRYNVLQNNLRRGMHFSGGIDSARVYNNTIYVPSGLADPVVIFNFKNWGGWPDDTLFQNNIVQNHSSDASYVLGSSTNTVLDYNLLYNPGGAATNEPSDSHKLTSDPLLIAPGTGANGWDSVNGYMLRSGSPAIGSGVNVGSNGNSDYWGNYVPDTGAPHRGAYNGAAGYVVEFEGLTRTSSGATTSFLSDVDASGGSYIRLNSDGVGDYAQFTTGTIAAGFYEFRLRHKGYTTRGQHSVTVNGVAVGGTVDQYAAASGFVTVSVGRVRLATTGTQTIRFTVTGKNAAANGYQLTADLLTLVPIPVPSFEAENTTWTAVGAAAQVVSDASMSGGAWVHLAADGTGDSFEFVTRMMPAGSYRVKLEVKAYNNRGQHTVHVDGTQVGGTFDQYAASTTYQTIDCGIATLTTSDLHTVKLTVNGKNASSSGYQLSVSRIYFEPQ